MFISALLDCTTIVSVFSRCLFLQETHLVTDMSIIPLFSARYWEDPHKFNPSRFLGDWPRDAFLPFSGGKYFIPSKLYSFLISSRIKDIVRVLAKGVFLPWKVNQSFTLCVLPWQVRGDRGTGGVVVLNFAIQSHGDGRTAVRRRDIWAKEGESVALGQ